MFNDFLTLRFNTMSEKELKKEAQKALIDIDISRSYFEKALNITPIKEFGTNYAEHYHSGESAIAKLLNEARAHKQSGAKGEYKGQVAGAFHRDDIGDITLAWGDKGTGKSDGWGLSKIAEYHPEVLHKLDKLIQDLPIVKETENRYKLDNGDFFISIRKDFEGQKQNWVLTALERDESIARRRTDLPSSQSEAEKTTSANATAIIPQNNAIPQQKIKFAMQKFNYDEKKAKDLLEWHKDSHHLTKDKNGLPKVFYHGSKAKGFEVFDKNRDTSGVGFFFSPSKTRAKKYVKSNGELFEVFIKAKNLFDTSNAVSKEEAKKIFGDRKSIDQALNEQELAFIYSPYQSAYGGSISKKYQEAIKKAGYDGIIGKKIDGEVYFVVFDSNQIKHIDNKGSYTDTKGNITKDKPKGVESTHTYFNESSPNIYQSNAHLGSGLVGGSVSGVEQDENGNLTFSPTKFALGFLGGSVASKAVSSGYKMAKARYYEKNFDKFIDDVNAKKSQMQPRFQVTQELEKSYRENEVKVSDGIAEKLGLKGKVFADYIKLAQKHPEYFANPQEAKALTEYIAQNAKIGIKASKKEYELVFAEIQGGKGVFAIDLEYKGGKHRIRSVYLMKNSQYKRKLYEAKKLGEPILHF